MATLNFNANEVEPKREFTAIPAGAYPAVITNSEMRDTRSGNGQYLELEFEILDGECKGRRLWMRLNLVNPNPDAVRLAKADLAEICRAVDVMNPKDSSELHDIPLTVVVKCRKTPDGDIVNDIKSCRPRENAATPKPSQPAASTATASVKPPWAR